MAINVVLKHTYEVGIEAVSNESEVSWENNLLLLSCLGVTNSIVASNDLWVVVEEPEVDGIPDCSKGQRNDSQNKTGSQKTSGGISLFVEEADCKCQCYDKWDAQENANENIPPVNVVIEELIEDLEELADTHSND